MSEPSAPTPRPKKILIACGGTGGHLFPGIAVAQELQKRGHEAVLLISRKEIDADASDKYENLNFYSVPAVAKPSMFSLKMPLFLCKLANTYNACKRIIKKEEIDIVLGMGGFTSLPPVRAGKKMGLRCFVHDSNALPGKANRMTARWCDRVLIGLEPARSYFPKSDCAHVGTPVRDEFKEAADRMESRRALGLDLNEQDTLILTMGGSQGAIKLNTLLVQAAQQDPSTHYLIISGKKDLSRVQALAAGHANIHIMGFCAQMASAYAACDGVIARAGASSLCELSELGKACLLVPFPFAADDHQTHNARAYVKHQAAIMCQQDALTPAKVRDFVDRHIKNRVAREAMEAAMRAQSHPTAAAKIADIILG
ncbi:MAG: UDP-N-acetylglucosamine--N-acetylmuramyl-(pentapeptide) pyrophosphoryl-undecaprenol N-acetylglucosamine transferase [Akkermansia sp.]